MEETPKQSIYIIDDDLSVTKALFRLLSTFGFQVAAFASAEEFLNSLIKSGPGCLILDIHMPGMDGLELQRRLRTNRRKLKVIFITAHAREGDRERALSEGAVGFLTKPFSEEDLLELIKVAFAEEVPPEAR